MTPEATVVMIARLAERLDALEAQVAAKDATNALALTLAKEVQDGLNTRLLAASGLGAVAGGAIPPLVQWWIHR